MDKQDDEQQSWQGLNPALIEKFGLDPVVEGKLSALVAKLKGVDAAQLEKLVGFAVKVKTFVDGAASEEEVGVSHDVDGVLTFTEAVHPETGTVFRLYERWKKWHPYAYALLKPIGEHFNLCFITGQCFQDLIPEAAGLRADKLCVYGDEILLHDSDGPIMYTGSNALLHTRCDKALDQLRPLGVTGVRYNASYEFHYEMANEAHMARAKKAVLAVAKALGVNYGYVIGLFDNSLTVRAKSATYGKPYESSRWAALRKVKRVLVVGDTQTDFENAQSLEQADRDVLVIAVTRRSEDLVNRADLVCESVHEYILVLAFFAVLMGWEVAL